MEFHSEECCSELSKYEPPIKSLSENSTVLCKEEKLLTPVPSYTLPQTQRKGISIKEENDCKAISVKQEEECKGSSVEEDCEGILVKEEQLSIAMREEKNGAAIKNESRDNTSNVLIDSNEEMPLNTAKIDKNDAETKTSELMKDAALILDEGSSDLIDCSGTLKDESLSLDEHLPAHKHNKAESEQSVKDEILLQNLKVGKDVLPNKETKIKTQPFVTSEKTPCPPSSENVESNIVSPQDIVPTEAHVSSDPVVEHQFKLKKEGNLETGNSLSNKSSDPESGSVVNKKEDINDDNTILKPNNDKESDPASHKNGNAPESNKQSKLKCKKKPKKFSCKLCSREFRKPFQLKMHIIRTHEKRERKFRQYIISKREIIRTRSKSYSEEAKIRSLQERSSAVVGCQSEEVSEANGKQISGDSNSKQPIYSIVGSQLPSESKLQNPSVSSEVHECPLCKRTFQYKSWLNRHLLYHQKQEIEKKSHMKSNEMSALDREAIGSKTPSKLDSILGYKCPTTVVSKDRPFSCSECGKQFTTKKNCRRHKRLIHNILVRPERTKLPYSNYTVEKPDGSVDDRSSTMTKETVSYKEKTFKRENMLNRWRSEAKARKMKKSSGIAVRLFDPSQLRPPDRTTPNPKKIEWGVSSNRTGPPPAARSPISDEAYRKMLDQEAALKDISVIANPWRSTHKPNPFIPKAKKALDVQKKTSPKIQETTNLIIPVVPKKPFSDAKSNRDVQRLQVKGPIDLSSMEERKTSLTKPDVKEHASSLEQWVNRASINQNANQTLISTNIEQPAMRIDQPTIKKEPCDAIPNLKRKLVLDESLKKKLARDQEYERKERTSESIQGHRQSVSATNQYVKEKILPPLFNIASLIHQRMSTIAPALNQKSQKHAQTTKKEESAATRPDLIPEFQRHAHTKKEENTVTRPALTQESQIHAQTKTKECTTTRGSKQSFSCNVCNLVFATFLQVNQHVALHADQWPFKCEICAQLFKEAQELVKHRNTHVGVNQTFSCEICKYNFVSMELLEHHKTDAHGPQLPKQPIELPQPNQQPIQTAMEYTCTKCSKKFQETAPFHSHIIDCALNDT